MLKIKRSRYRLIFNMGVMILERRSLYWDGDQMCHGLFGQRKRCFHLNAALPLVERLLADHCSDEVNWEAKIATITNLHKWIMKHKYFYQFKPHFVHLETREKREYFGFALHHKRSRMIKAKFSTLLLFLDIETHVTGISLHWYTSLHFRSPIRKSKWFAAVV